MSSRAPLDLLRTDLPSSQACPLEQRILQEVSEYQAQRVIVGTTLLSAPSVDRQASLWTLDDGEHLLLLRQAQHFCFWTATRLPLEQLRARAIGWLTEPHLHPPLRQFVPALFGDLRSF